MNHWYINNTTHTLSGWRWHQTANFRRRNRHPGVFSNHKYNNEVVVTKAAENVFSLSRSNCVEGFGDDMRYQAVTIIGRNFSDVPPITKPSTSNRIPQRRKLQGPLGYRGQGRTILCYSLVRERYVFCWRKLCSWGVGVAESFLKISLENNAV